MSEESKTKLLEEVLNFFVMMGVRENVGADGKLMSKIIAELSGTATFTRIEVPKGTCPVCGARDMTACDCDPMEQLLASQK